MRTITTYSVYEYLKGKFPTLEPYLKNGTIDRKTERSIGVFLGSETRSVRNIAVGGLECTTVRMLPVNILVHWTENQQVCDEKATEIFDAILCEKSNFIVGKVKIAMIELLDGCPMQTGRDEKNVCESTIRANFYYYV